ncbi:hypothetical protein RKE29_23805 [Streptomyces sp. B1866]|uniref:hypothetical protein n=1 Tax=Streptomyces sp. B1866 TaxID=3075431 RepID=UPI00288EB1F7|nr:hypothetical protein [Streptomyces sp. B1866]MDT3399629.1 hypothetical protein [Streptomyces sp. B1866]
MPLCDYFSAPDDATATGVLDEPGGPDPSALDVLPLKGVDPVVVLPRLEAVLTGRTYDEVSGLPRSGQLLSSPEADGQFVVSVSDSLQEALAAAPPASLAEAAGPWSETEELRQSGVTAEAVLEALTQLAALAARAREAGRRLYCWWAL